VFWFTALALPPDSWLMMHWHWLWLQPDHLAHQVAASWWFELVPQGQESQPPINIKNKIKVVKLAPE
jgi:hypothetical protein